MKLVIIILATAVLLGCVHEPPFAGHMREYLLSIGKSHGYADGFAHGTVDGNALVAEEPSRRLYRHDMYAKDPDYKAGYDDALKRWQLSLADFDHPKTTWIFPRSSRSR